MKMRLIEHFVINKKYSGTLNIHRPDYQDRLQNCLKLAKRWELGDVWYVGFDSLYYMLQQSILQLHYFFGYG